MFDGVSHDVELEDRLLEDRMALPIVPLPLVPVALNRNVVSVVLSTNEVERPA
jgi:hypothetical protein